ncbi:agmatine deiminase family protein [Arcticibacter eurypsychrophilus]|uniref:agmatine deiminase family protein n=1 Tax=Arcticibacter eurypsychrophilus TaxID=1434752 RepID=UPI00084DECF0|nr:agmatine deiminase family protein [Arcticibacter eurypsychrophilus]
MENKFRKALFPAFANGNTPAQLGYTFPAEWAQHEATWLSWPHKEASWPGKIANIYKPYAQFVKLLASSEKVRINVLNESMKAFVLKYIIEAGADLQQVDFFIHPTDDAWCRDHGPAFLVNSNAADHKKVIVDWGYNAWGGKYPPFDQDDVIPTLIGKEFNIPVFHPGIIMEGGSVEFNGAGTILTSRCCLLNENRNPDLNQDQIEAFLHEFYGATQVLWIDEGIIGDDTDGHIDDTIRFVSEDTVLSAVETDIHDDNYDLLQQNLKTLSALRLLNGKQLNIIELPMPDAVIYDEMRLPASYANFYISNKQVIVPTYRCKKDDLALDLISSCFKDREVVGLDSTDIIWGLGSFHCLSQQEPKV